MRTRNLLLSLLVAFIAVQVTFAFLRPECSDIPFTPGCTNDPSQVTPTLPTCVQPFSVWSTVGRSYPGNSPRPNGVVPPWFNLKLARRGQQVVEEYRFPWYVVMFFGLLVEINMPDVRNPIMFNKKNTNGPDNAKRDMATLMQGLVWTKNYFWKLPQDGKSSYIDSIKSTRMRHIDVQTRGQAKVDSVGCIVTPDEWESLPVDEVLWNAFEWDIGNTTKPWSRELPPSNWLQCPPDTECGNCDNCTNCDPIFSKNNPNQTEPCHHQDDNCTLIGYDCSGCTACRGCVNSATPACRYTQADVFDTCDSCQSDVNLTSYYGCETCKYRQKCHPFTIPLYNQQAMNYVIYNLVAYPIIFKQQMGMGSMCDADLWAFNHLWAVIGYGLGIDNQWNVMLQPDLNTARNYYQQMFDELILPGLFHFDTQTKYMMDNVFKGLSTATGGFMSPTFLLHRFVKYFLGIPAPNLEALMSDQEKGVDEAFNLIYLPQFMNNKLFRATINIGINDFTYFVSNIIFPGNCTTYTKISKQCFVQ